MKNTENWENMNAEDLNAEEREVVNEESLDENPVPAPINTDDNSPDENSNDPHDANDSDEGDNGEPSDGDDDNDDSSEEDANADAEDETEEEQKSGMKKKEVATLLAVGGVLLLVLILLGIFIYNMTHRIDESRTGDDTSISTTISGDEDDDDNGVTGSEGTSVGDENFDDGKTDGDGSDDNKNDGSGKGDQNDSDGKGGNTTDKNNGGDNNSNGANGDDVSDSNILNDFSVRHRYLWQVGFNGRNSGYLVLYQGYAKPSGYKSVCTECGQRNYKSVSETGNCKCGRCGANARIDYVTPPLEVGCYPGRNTDMGEDFADWEMYQLRERVKLVCDFDKLCDDILTMVAGLVENYEVCEETVYRPEVIKHLCEVAS